MLHCCLFGSYCLFTLCLLLLLFRLHSLFSSRTTRVFLEKKKILPRFIVQLEINFDAKDWKSRENALQTPLLEDNLLLFNVRRQIFIAKKIKCLFFKTLNKLLYKAIDHLNWNNFWLVTILQYIRGRSIVQQCIYESAQLDMLHLLDSLYAILRRI
jgi:hypothetical protein